MANNDTFVLAENSSIVAVIASTTSAAASITVC